MDRLIYALTDPRTEEVRYVGLSTRGESRPRRQCSRGARRDSTHRSAWTQSLISRGLRPNWCILEVCETQEQLLTAERFWISYYRARGFDLTNHCAGGKFGTLDEVAREKHRAAHVKSHCARGHEFTDANSGPNAKPNTRFCRTCRAAWIAANRTRIREYHRARYLRLKGI